MIPLEVRFWQKVDKSGECWEWTAAKHPQGYGHVKVKGVVQRAHRVAYELTRGQIPAGAVLDHLCRNTSCVRPDHLEVVTHWENVRRGVGYTAEQARKTHCVNGHEFTPENTDKVGNGRGCRTCRRAASVRNGKRRRAEAV